MRGVFRAFPRESQAKPPRSNSPRIFFSVFHLPGEYVAFQFPLSGMTLPLFFPRRGSSPPPQKKAVFPLPTSRYMSFPGWSVLCFSLLLFPRECRPLPYGLSGLAASSPNDSLPPRSCVFFRGSDPRSLFFSSPPPLLSAGRVRLRSMFFPQARFPFVERWPPCLVWVSPPFRTPLPDEIAFPPCNFLSLAVRREPTPAARRPLFQKRLCFLAAPGIQHLLPDSGPPRRDFFRPPLVDPPSCETEFGVFDDVSNFPLLPPFRYRSVGFTCRRFCFLGARPPPSSTLLSS